MMYCCYEVNTKSSPGQCTLDSLTSSMDRRNLDLLEWGGNSNMLIRWRQWRLLTAAEMEFDYQDFCWAVFLLTYGEGLRSRN